MRETPEEIAELQRMFDAYLARANPHMTAIVTPERRLTTQQVVRYLDGTSSNSPRSTSGVRLHHPRRSRPGLETAV